jgi:hypothetical protein
MRAVTYFIFMNRPSIIASLAVSIVALACEDGRRFSSPTAPLGPATLSPSTPTPTPEPPRHAVYGTVYEVTLGGRAPVEGAWVTESSELHAGVYTARDGAYRFTGLFEGANTIKVSKDGYRDVSLDITITGELRLDVELVRQ